LVQRAFSCYAATKGSLQTRMIAKDWSEWRWVFSFYDVEIKFGYCYVHAWNKKPESIFQNSNYTRPV